MAVKGDVVLVMTSVVDTGVVVPQAVVDGTPQDMKNWIETQTTAQGEFCVVKVTKVFTRTETKTVAINEKT